MDNKDTMIIADMLKDFFNIKLSKSAMYFQDDIYYQTPALYFRLVKDNNNDNNYQLIENAVDSFEGNLKWRFGKSYPSRINYEIIPKIARDTDDNCFKETGIWRNYKYNALESEYKKICELAIADIPYLYQHMKEYFEKNKPIDND
ncbi:hypothetical protein [uncultured Vagococcus sp.]|uniref:hypothetical protein n=1 Tax=uncultured Vagococcus sp. TaxID=189676 RepID=UPI0028D279A9|nr:hypothetical protein [uncultured Vagococcus sp.]